MKISDKEMRAAEAAWGSALTPLGIERMRAVLEVAYAVRKARKAKKRAKAKPSILDEDQQEAQRQPERPVRRFKVGDRVSNIAPIGAFDANAHGTVVSAESGQYRDGCYFVRFDDAFIRAGYLGATTTWLIHGAYLDIVSEPEPAAPAWNGKFEVGKSYRTRGGRRVEVSEISVDGLWPIKGRVLSESRPLSWGKDGESGDYHTEHYLDLIGPWED